ncbi:OmpA family protein [Chitinimonas naiadis]
MNTLNRCLSLDVIGLAFAGCQTTPPKNAALENARLAYLRASADPQVAQHGALELERAKQSLEKADAQWAKDRNGTETRHQAYLVEQRVRTAQAAATGRQADTDVRQAGSERQQLIADARSKEANQAKVQAAMAEMKANQAQQQADISQQQAMGEAQRASMLQSALESLAAQHTNRGTVVTLGDVLFDVGQATLRPSGNASVSKLATVLRDYPERRVLIEGHTDSTGSASFNQSLSERRALSVKRALVAQGVADNRVETFGYGKDNPVADNSSTSGRQQNRRVEIIISDANGKVSQR